MAIKGLSKVRRIPRAGMIRLGIKVPVYEQGTDTIRRKKNLYTERMEEMSRPIALDAFVLGDVPEVAAKYGEEMFVEFNSGGKKRRVQYTGTKRLYVMLPTAEKVGEDEFKIFPHAYKYYKGSKLFCKGDGDKATRWEKRGDVIERYEMPCLGEACPEFGPEKCSFNGLLSVILPEIRASQVYQITTGSRNSIININSQLHEYAGMFCSRVAGFAYIPMWLEIVPMDTQHPKTGQPTTIHVMQLELADFNLAEAYQRMRDGRELIAGIGDQAPARALADNFNSGEAVELPDDEDVGAPADGTVVDEEELLDREKAEREALRSRIKRHLKALNITDKAGVNKVLDGRPYSSSDPEEMTIDELVDLESHLYGLVPKGYYAAQLSGDDSITL